MDIRLHTVIYKSRTRSRTRWWGCSSRRSRRPSGRRRSATLQFPGRRIAGCGVVDGKITRTAEIRLLRDNVVIFEGRLSSLKRFKDDASEVKNGFECGIGIDRFNDVKIGDIIEAFAMEKIIATRLAEEVTAPPAGSSPARR